MAYHSLSVGDIMMLSQQSWKVGNAFAAGRSGAPPEFQVASHISDRRHKANKQRRK